MPRYRTSELLLVVLFTACVSFQLFVPPAIGLANNGDFAKMVGRFSLAPASLDTSEEYAYFTAGWVYNRAFYWLSDDRSSELIPISAAVLTDWWFSSRVFDIRTLGAIHALLWIACFAAFLSLLRPVAAKFRYVIGIAAAFIFTDVSYVACLNSFYTDVAAFLFLAWALVLWLHFLNRGKPSAALFAMFVTASILCVSSKAQHAVLGLFLCVPAAIAALRFKGWWRKTWAFVACGLILAAAAVSFRLMPHEEKSDDAYAGIFMILLHNSPTTLDDLRELGLGPEYLRYVDHWPIPTFADEATKQAWWGEFNRRTGHGQIAWFILRHPWRSAAIIYRSLHVEAAKRRPDLGNYERQYGFPPRAKTNSFGWWSALRSFPFRFAPWHILLWYLGLLAAGIWFAIRGRAGMASHLGALGALLGGMGLVELAIGSMADAGEIPRHLLLFHIITDFTIVLALVCAALFFQGRASFRANS